MNALDGYIDRIWSGTRDRGGRFTSFSRSGAIFNVVVCGLIVVGSIASTLSGQLFGVLVAAGGLLMEAAFARILFRAYRGDFDEDGT